LLVFVLLLASIARAQPKIEWSNPDLCTTPQGNVQFHGEFGRESVNVTASSLGKHDFIRISFDLLIIHTWDGNWLLGTDGLPAELGPDSIRIGLKDGPTLMFSTFSNVPYVENSKSQNFPSLIPGDAMPAQYGAIETDTHGYMFPNAPVNPPINQDSTYKIEFLVPHRDERAVVQMTGLNLQDLVNESWGVSDFRVEALSGDNVKSPTIDEIAGAFAEALRPDSVKQYAALETLIRGMDVTATWIQMNVEPATIDEASTLKQAASLSHDGDAIASLLTLGPQLEVFLRHERHHANSDGRCRIDRILQSISVTPIANENVRRVMLATRVLEIIGTPQAMELRRKLVAK
jgi:hypothetical protein